MGVYMINLSNFFLVFVSGGLILFLVGTPGLVNFILFSEII